MKRSVISALVVVLAAFVAGFTWFGGWAVVSVASVPDGWTTGKPLQLSWQVRQHAVTVLRGLKPTIEARSGSRVIEGTASDYDANGVKEYRGQLTFPNPGDWQVTIKSGFGRSKAVLVPFRVVDARTRAPTVTDSERGRRMFASLGCVSCHVHRDVDIKGELSDFGPDLSEKKFPPAYLAKFLAKPSIKPPTNGKQMPNLDLRQSDINTLIAFINAERRVTSR
jgi:hypothetical protein